MIMDDNFDEKYEDDPIADILLEEAKLNGFGLVSLIIGILAVFIWIPCFPFLGGASGVCSVISGLPALIFGIIGARRKKRKHGMAVAGLVLGIISVVVGALLSLLALVSAIYLIAGFGVDEFGYFLTSAWDFLYYNIL